MSVVISRDIKAIDVEIKNLDKSIKSATASNKALDKSLKLDPKNTVLLAQKTENLKKQIELTTEKIKKLKDAQALVDRTIANGKGEEEYKRLSVEIAKAEAQMKSFAAQAHKAGTQKLTDLQNGLKTVGRIAGAALLAIIALGKAYTDTGDEIAKATERYNTSAEDFQKNKFVFDRTTGNENAYAQALENVQTQLSAAAKGSAKAVTAFKAVGISLDELQGLGAADALNLIVERLSEIEDYDQRVTIANELLTSTGTEVAQVAELTASELANLNAQCEENGIISQESAESAAALKDKWEDFQSKLKSVGMELGDALIPVFEALTEVAKALLPVIKFLTDIFTSMPKEVQTIIVVVLIVLMILPKLIAIFKALRMVILALNIASSANPFMMIAKIIVIVIGLVILLATSLSKTFNKKYTLDVDTSSLNNQLSEYTGKVQGQPDTGTQTNNSTNTYYDYSTVNVEAHTDADIDTIAEQLSTKIKVGGK